MSYVFCNGCGHRNPPTSAFCSACGSVLDQVADRTVTIAKVDPLQDAPGPSDDVVVSLPLSDHGHPVLVVRQGPQAGERFVLSATVTQLGRHPDSDISLDDITVSRRHAEIVLSSDGYLVRDAGSLNGTYVNGERVDSTPLAHGDEIQVGKFRLIFFEQPEA
jgi:FHA domain